MSDPFAFTPQSGVAPGTLVASNAVAVGGIDRVQLMSPAGVATQAQATLPLGGVSDRFDVVTRGAPPPQPVPLLGPGAMVLIVTSLALAGLGAIRRPLRR